MDEFGPRQTLQHHYTSCRKGCGAGPGFQTRCQSERLQPSDRVEIERRGVYIAPRDLTQEPNEEEIDQNFPRAFRYCLLESGRWALIHSCYAGRDYSGRWGNYFAHALIGEGNAPPLAWPIDLYEWSGWKRRLTSDEDTDAPPPSLPLVDLADIPSAVSFTFEELRDFLREDPTRRSGLEAMIRALFLHRESSRALVVRDTFVNGLFWTACIQKSLPIAYARQITFSTYQFDDRQCAAVNMTTSGTDFIFDETQREYRFFMFDRIHGSASEVPHVCTKYAATLADWMANDPRRLEDFHNFVSLFAQGELGTELESLLRIFEMRYGQPLSLNQEQRKAILQFVHRYSTVEGRNVLFPTIMDLGLTLKGEGTGEDYVSVIRFLSSAAASNQSSEHRRQVFEYWCAMFDDLMVTRRRGNAEVRAAYAVMMKALGSFEAELAKVFLETDHMLFLRACSLPDEQLEAILTEVCGFLRVLGRFPLHNQPEARWLMDAVVVSAADKPSAVRGILVVFGTDEVSVVDVCRFLAGSSESPEQGRIVGRGLSQSFAEKPESFANAVRQRLDDARALEILLGEWLDLAHRAEDKLGAFRKYFEAVVRRLPNYRAKYTIEIARELARSLAPALRCAQAVRWLDGHEIDAAPDAFYQECVGWINDGLPFDPTDASAHKLSVRLVRWAEIWHVALIPNRPVLQDAIRATRSSGEGLGEETLRILPRAIEGIGRDGYKTFLSYFLPNALEEADNNPARHRRVLLSVFVPPLADVARDAYLQFLSRPSKHSFGKTDLAALLVWLSCGSPDTADSPLALKNPSLQILRRKIEALSLTDLRGLDEIVRENYQGTGNAPTEWRRLLKSVAENQPSVLGWARRILGGHR